MIIQGKVWGHTTPLFNKNNVELHIAQIKQGGYCSKHLHKFKYNRFIVLKGKLRVTIWKNYGTECLQDVSILEASQECTVPPGDFHQFEALEDTTALEVYWVELSENDITRFDHGGMCHEKAPDQSITVARTTAANAKAHLYSTDYSSGNCQQTNDQINALRRANLYGTKHFGNETSQPAVKECDERATD